MQKLAIFDIDGTFYRWQLFHEVMIRLADGGYFDATMAREIQGSYHAWQAGQDSFDHFSGHTIEAFYKYLAAIPPTVMEQIAAAIIAETGHRVYRYTRNLAAKLHADGYYTVALSGSMQEVVAPFAARYGLDDGIGEFYERTDDRYTGTISRQVIGHKAEVIRDYAASHHLTLDDSYAIGDSESDVDMLELVAHPIVFNPSEGLLTAADQRGWPVVLERKNIAYTLEVRDGIRLLARTEPL